MGEIIGIHLQTGPVLAYSAESTIAESNGAVLLLHDIWGLDDHTKSVADRLAAQGYHALAPNLLAGTEMERRMRPELQNGLFSPSQRERSFAQTQLSAVTAPLRSPHVASVAIMRAHACFEYLYALPKNNERVGLLGFGYGGTHTFSVAVREPRLAGAVVYYGPTSYVSYELSHIQCPILAFYGERDGQAYPSLLRVRPIMQSLGLSFEPILYEGAGPYFFNDSIIGAYDSYAANDSWSRTMSFFHKNLR